MGTEEPNKYQVFARKWRPRTFDEVTGQQHIVRALRNAINLDRLPNAYIFSGIRGIGKTSLARIVATSINCEKGRSDKPCLECATCREIIDGRSIDVIEIDGASNTGVDDVREIRDSLQYAPAKCRKKMYIVDEVHMLSKAAFNAFLKTLEEPPPHTLFIFATTELNKIPETVMSRCQCFEFKSLSENQIVEKLKGIAERENISVEDGALKMVAKRADGSMRDAESLLDQVVSYGDGKIDEQTAGSVLGLVSRERIWSLLDSIFSKDVARSISELHSLYYSGYEVSLIIREMFEAVSELAIVKAVSNPSEFVEETSERIESMKRSVANVSPTRLQQFYDLLLRAESQGKIARNAISVLEMTVLKMIRLDEVVPVDDIIKSIKGGIPLPVVTPQRTSPPPAAGEAVVSENRPRQYSPQGGLDWEEVRGAIAAKKFTLSGPLDLTRFSLENGSAVLHYPVGDNFVKSQLEKNLEYIESEISRAAGKKVSLSLVPEENRAAPSPVAEKKSPEIDGKMKTAMLNDPLIAKAVDIFEGKVGFDD